MAVTEHNPDGWTFATTHRRIDDVTRRFDDLRADDQRAITAALEAVKEGNAASMAASEKAIAKQEGAAKERFEDANHIRGAMLDQQSKFASNEKVDALAAQVAEIKNQRSGEAGQVQGVGMSRTQMATIIGILVSVSGVILGVLVMFQ